MAKHPTRRGPEGFKRHSAKGQRFERAYLELLDRVQGNRTIGIGTFYKVLGYGEDTPDATKRHGKTDFIEWLEENEKPVELVSTARVRVKLVDKPGRKGGPIDRST